VHSTQGDLFLCKECEDFRFPYTVVEPKKAHKHLPNARAISNTAVKKDEARSKDVRRGECSTGTTTIHNQDISEPNPAPGCTNPQILVNELLTYVIFHRNSCTSAALVRVICGFFTPNEIAGAKKCLIGVFGHQLSDSTFVTERRASTSRQAHEAEMDDILGIIDYVDSKDSLETIRFVAADLSRLPGYGPEDTNMCAVVDRQQRLDTTVAGLTTKMESLSQLSHDNTQKVSTALSQQLIPEIRNAISSMEKKMDEVHRAVNNITSKPAQTKSMDQSREKNIIVFGVAEALDWRVKLTDVINFVAGREVTVNDAFRVGRAVTGSDKPRPIIVKLCNVWDRRLVLSNCRILSSCTNYMSKIFIAADEPLEERRKKTIRRLYNKARGQQKVTELSEDGASLYIDSVLVFTVKDGDVRSNAGDNGEH